MNDGGAGGDTFAVIDPKLTVFALANGVDLAKGADHRRLEWFSDGFERAILVAGDGRGFDLAVLKWKSGQAESAQPEAFRAGVAEADVMRLLDEAIEAANAL